MSKSLENTLGYRVVYDWLAAEQRHPFLFQQQTWQHINNGESGLVNAPTGCGKTYSVFLGAIINFINKHPQDYHSKKNSGLQLLWITPLRALAKDISRAMEEVIVELGMKWKIGIRNGDTNTTERARQKRQMPEVLIITPESLHLLLAQKEYEETFSSLKIIAVDEWHELLGSKRGVQVELAISRIAGLQLPTPDSPLTSHLPPLTSHFSPLTSHPSPLTSHFSPLTSHPSPLTSHFLPLTSHPSLLTSHLSPLTIWGISATIGNLEEAKNVLMAPLKEVGVIVKANMNKRIEVESIFPDEIEKYPWAGHLGIRLIHKIIPIIQQSRTTLIFINTRGMSETWYQKILDACPDLAGSIALHHGSIDMELRNWVEENLHSGKLKAVVCTASLDLGVDFRPVETVIQVGSPKGVARFLQRAGRSGHSFDAVSKIYFLPTHSLELMEAAALKKAISNNIIESRMPMLLCYDVLIQYLNTLAVSGTFEPDKIFEEVISTHCYKEMSKEEWERILYFITTGGNALQQYDDYKKMEWEDGVYKIKNRRIAMRHRMNIGTIVSESMLKVKFISGGYVGVIEEYFISKLATRGCIYTGRKKPGICNDQRHDCPGKKIFF